jgi:thiol-disulfide isomerase/thioredoxin
MLDRRYIGLLIGLTLISSAWGQSTEPAVTTTQNDVTAFDPAAVEILNETFKVYRNCQSYQDKVRLTVTMIDDKAKDKSKGKTRSFDSQMIFERPNKMVFIWPSVTLNCDGKRCQVYYPDLQQYTNQKAPAELSRAYLETLLMENFMTFVINGLTSDTPFEDSMRGKEKLEYKQTIAKKGVEYHRVQFVDGNDLVEILIDTKEKLIRSMTITPLDPKKRKWQLDLDYTLVELNKPIPADKFAIKEPADAKKVDRISFTRQFDYPKEGQRVPDFALAVWGGGDQKKTVNELLGSKVTFVTFWASWCMPCRGELPILESIYAEYKDKGLEVVAVNLDSADKTDEIKSLVSQLKLSFPILLDPKALYPKELLVQNLPTLLVLDSKGKIVECHVGTSPDVRKELRAIAEEMINKK